MTRVFHSAPVAMAVGELARRYHGQPVLPGPQDVYKLVYHAALGSEHAVADSAAATQWMERELSTLAPVTVGPTEPLVEPLGDFARVHLRPFIAAGGSTTELLAAFIRTARRPAARERLPRALDVVVDTARGADWPWSAETLAAYFAAQREAGYPAVHHSRAFGECYAPAYRVVSTDELRALLSPRGVPPRDVPPRGVPR